MSLDVTTRHQKAAVVGVCAALIGVAVAVALVLREHGPGDMGNGMLAGIGLALAASGVALARALLRPEQATTFERAWTQTGDERDDAVLTRSLAVVGLLSLPLSGVAAIAVALGVAPEMVFTLLIFGLIGILATAFTLIHRRS